MTWPAIPVGLVMMLISLAPITVNRNKVNTSSEAVQKYTRVQAFAAGKGCWSDCAKGQWCWPQAC